MNFTATDAMTVLAGLRKESDTSAGYVVALGDVSGGNNGSFNLSAPTYAAPTVGFYSRGTALSANNYNNASHAAPWLGVCTGSAKISTDTLILRTNGVQRYSTATDQGTGNYGTWPLTIGNIATYPYYSGRLYSLIVRGAASTGGEIASAETWVGGKTGIAL